MPKIDLNSDLGESFGAYKMGLDSQIMQFISSANIACGYHAGDSLVMEQSVREAKAQNVAVGAHPGLPDLVGFGRRNMSITTDEARTYVQYQVGALWAMAKAQGVPMQHVKLHGALYNMASADENLASAICAGIAAVNPELIVLGLSGSHMITQARHHGLRAACEVFADRAYQDNGQLVPRSQPGSVIHDPELTVKRIVGMVTNKEVTSINGNVVKLEVDSICVHGDNPKAVDQVSKIRDALTAAGVEIVNLGGIFNG